MATSPQVPPPPIHTYLQLDAARKDSEAQRRRAAAVEGAAASAMAASPFPGGGGGNMMMMMRGGGVSGGGGGMSGGGGGGTRRTTREEDDSMDAEVDDLLQQLQVCEHKVWICYRGGKRRHNWTKQDISRRPVSTYFPGATTSQVYNHFQPPPTTPSGGCHLPRCVGEVAPAAAVQRRHGGRRHAHA